MRDRGGFLPGAIVVMLFALLTVVHLRAEYQFGSGDARAAAAIYPLDQRYWFALGVAELRGGLYGQSIEHLSKAIRLRPLNVDGLNTLGVAHALLGQRQQAVRAFKMVLKITPRHGEARRNLDTVMKGFGKYEITVLYQEQ